MGETATKILDILSVIILLYLSYLFLLMFYIILFNIHVTLLFYALSYIFAATSLGLGGCMTMGALSDVNKYGGKRVFLFIINMMFW